MKNPKTVAEWREAALGAEAAIALDDCRMYGLLVGGPTVNRERCLSIIDRAKARGISFSREQILEAAVDLVRQMNAE